MVKKQFLTEEYCPNLIYENEQFAIGVLKTWSEYENHPMAESWNYMKKYFEENIKRQFYFFTCWNKTVSYPSRFLLICTDFTLIGKPMWCINEDGEKIKDYEYDFAMIEKMRNYLITEYHKKEEHLTQKVEDTKAKIDAFDVEHTKNTFESTAYDVSSELFSFKELKRTVIEHGKECYINGYNAHKQLFKNYLIKQGYFTKNEILKIYGDFETTLTQGSELTIETVEKYLRERDILVYQDGRWVTNSDITLTDIQKNILKLYQHLDKNVYFLRIQKPRQKGVTTILKIIAQIEALNNKNVLYVGYGPCEPQLKKIKNITYEQINSYCSLSLNERCLLGKKYDVIIIDEITSFVEPYMLCDQLLKVLSDNGKIVLVGTPCDKKERNYKSMKMFFSNDILNIEGKNRMIHYGIPPTEDDYIRAEKYPERKNEILGQFLV